MIHPVGYFPELQNPPFARMRATLVNPLTQPGSPIAWMPLFSMHPFSVSVEPSAELPAWVGTVIIYVSDEPQAPVATTFNFPTLGDPIVSAPSSTMYDAPWGWIGAQLVSQSAGGVHVFVKASQFSRVFQP